ncbi:MAG: fibronectin type III domain-containing protein, partial [Lentimicrobium sp.]|nr:fibronectin type III domain-containing protein [Lentimicrobium sp.]
MKLSGLRFYSLLFALVMVFSNARAQLPAPVIECVSVLDDGSLEVSWTMPPLPYDAFDGFRIFCQIPGLPGTVPTFEFTDITATSGILTGGSINGQLELYNITMVTFINGNPVTSLVSDIVYNNMFLKVTNEG